MPLPYSILVELSQQLEERRTHNLPTSPPSHQSNEEDNHDADDQQFAMLARFSPGESTHLLRRLDSWHAVVRKRIVLL